MELNEWALCAGLIQWKGETMRSIVGLIVGLVLGLAHCKAGSVELHNAADPGVEMPIVGLGTGGYRSGPSSDPHAPEWWNDTVSYRAVLDWFSVGGVRIDTSHTYHDEVGIGKALAASGLPRSSYFVTSKVGPGDPLGYNDTLQQYEVIARELGSGPDLLLIHWPAAFTSDGFSPDSSDPFCNSASPQRNTSLCRQSTWKAMLRLWREGKVRAVGVSNFAVQHLQDLVQLGDTMPAVLQSEFQPYWQDSPQLFEFCKRHNIVFNSYAPLGSPDWAPNFHHWPNSILQDPTLSQIATTYPNTSVAKLVLAWQTNYGMVVNPRTENKSHMREAISAPSLTLRQQDVQKIETLALKKLKSCPDPNTMP